MSEPINIKMKLADPAEMDRLLTAALKEHYPGEDSDAYVSEMVRSIHKVLFQSGYILIQVDNDTTSTT